MSTPVRVADPWINKISTLTGVSTANVPLTLVQGGFKRQIQTVPGLRDTIRDWLLYMDALYLGTEPL